MSEFNKKGLTTKGEELSANLLTGDKITFTKIVLGSGKYTGEISDATALVSPQNELAISSITRSGTTVKLRAVLLKANITSTYELSEIGVFAKTENTDEVLYYYAFADTYTSIISKDSTEEQIIEISVICSSVAELTAVIDNSIVFATHQDLEDHNISSTAHEDIRSALENKVDGNNTTLQGGNGATASGLNAIALGYNSVASNDYATAVGTGAATNSEYYTLSSNIQTTAIGYNAKATGNRAQALGSFTTASGDHTTVLGYNSVAIGDYSTALGRVVTSNGNYSTAIGYKAISNGNYSTALGFCTTSNYKYETALGCHNAVVDSVSETTGNLLTVGNGTGSTSTSNAFRVTYAGVVYANGSYNSAGADFAEYFEWADGNPNDDDRIGYFVTLDGDKIVIANKGDDILGIVSGTAGCIGNAYDDNWYNRYEYDKWGRLQFENVIIPAVYETITNENGEEEQVLVEDEHTVYTMKTNPNYIPSLEYEPRSKRKEWSVVGMLGQIYLRDDGTCEVGGYCKCTDGGIATKSDNGYRVMKRIDESTIQVLFK